MAFERRASGKRTSGKEDPAEPGVLRLPLAPRQRLLSFERRIKLWLAAAGVAILLPAGVLIPLYLHSMAQSLGLLALVAGAYLLLADIFREQLLRPLQTLANIVSAIREEDYSFRARGARRGDAVGDLALELNALSGALQTQRAAAQDAFTLLERVLTSMHSPVLAFDDRSCLRMLNAAARNAFALGSPEPIGRSAAELHLEDLLALSDQELYPPAGSQGDAHTDRLTAATVRWSVRRATFRLHGLPHHLLVLSDIAAVLREEERLAWQRLIRVLSHEINNSLTPIKSIAGSLHARTSALAEDDQADFARGLSVIEERAASLNRFLQAYQRLTHLPAPTLREVELEGVVSRTAHIETRLPVAIVPGAAETMLCDSDQIQQALINLLRNAADAALAPDANTPGHIPAVSIGWSVTPSEVRFTVEDNGLGIDNPSNLFVPFYTTKQKGSGIGLVLARQIASAHRGRVLLQPHPEHRGCLATLTLPIQSAMRAGGVSAGSATA